MRRPWLPDLVHGVGSLGGLLLVLAVIYDLAHVVPGPMMLTVMGLLFGGAPLGRAGALWLQERREPAAQLPEVKMALELRSLIREHGQGPVMRAVQDATLHRRALPRGDDHHAE